MPEEKSLPKFLKPNQVQEIFGIPATTIHNWKRKDAKGDHPKPFKLERGGIFVPTSEIEDYIEKAKRRSR